MRAVVTAVILALMAPAGGAVELMEVDAARLADIVWSAVDFEPIVPMSDEWQAMCTIEAELCATPEYRAAVMSMRQRGASEGQERWFRIWKLTSRLSVAAKEAQAGLLSPGLRVSPAHSGRGWDFWENLSRLGVYSMRGGWVEEEFDVDWVGARPVLDRVLTELTKVLEASDCDCQMPAIDPMRVPTRRR